MKPIVKDFKQHLERLGYSSGMVRMMPCLVHEFLTVVAKEIEQIKRPDIQSYVEYLSQRPSRNGAGGLSHAYIAHHLYSLRTFFGWLIERRQLSASPLVGFHFKVGQKGVRDVLSEAETNALYQACETLRELAILALCYGCGLRRSEATTLQLTDVSFRTGLLYVRSGKGQKRRAVPMSKGVMQALENYVVYERYGQPGEQAFLCNSLGRGIKCQWLNKQVRKLTIRANIEKNITPHGLRHSIATHLLGRGLSLEEVRDFLGHAHIETTQRYTRVYQQQIWNLKNNHLPHTSESDTPPLQLSDT